MTDYIIHLVLFILSIVSVSIVILSLLPTTSIEKMSKILDVTIKSAALIVGSLWAANRYFVLRTDVPQIRVDADVRAIRNFPTQGSDDKPGLLIFRLDVINTGKTLIQPFDHRVQIDSVSPDGGGVGHETRYKWPEEGFHPGGPIEPGSWSAINDEFACPESVKAVRIFVEIRPANGNSWTWHRTYEV